MFSYVSTELNSTSLEGEKNITRANSPRIQNFQYIVSIRFRNIHKCTGIVISQEHVLVVPECFYENNKLAGEIQLYEVWIPIPYKGLSGRYFKIADIDVNLRFGRDIGVLLVSHYTSESRR